MYTSHMDCGLLLSCLKKYCLPFLGPGESGEKKTVPSLPWAKAGNFHEFRSRLCGTFCWAAVGHKIIRVISPIPTIQ